MENDQEQKKRGVISHDRKLAGEVRRMTLDQIKKILETPKVEMSERDYELWKAILLSLSRSILPRLTELTGNEGEPLTIQMSYRDVSKMTLEEVDKALLEKVMR